MGGVSEKEGRGRSQKEWRMKWCLKEEVMSEGYYVKMLAFVSSRLITNIWKNRCANQKRREKSDDG